MIQKRVIFCVLSSCMYATISMRRLLLPHVGIKLAMHACMAVHGMYMDMHWHENYHARHVPCKSCELSCIACNMHCMQDMHIDMQCQASSDMHYHAMHKFEYTPHARHARQFRHARCVLRRLYSLIFSFMQYVSTRVKVFLYELLSNGGIQR